MLALVKLLISGLRVLRKRISKKMRYKSFDEIMTKKLPYMSILSDKAVYKPYLVFENTLLDEIS